MRRLFITWFIFGVAISIQQSSFAIYMARIFDMNAQMVGYLFTGIGVLILINQVVLLKRVWLKLGSKPRIAQIMLMVFGIGMILQSVSIFFIMIVGVVLATLGQGTLRTIYSSLIAGAVPEKRGEYLGIATALMSLAMVVGPLIVTFVITRHPALPFVIAGLLAFGVYFLNNRSKHNGIADTPEYRV
jgi:DHA1 family tetracycline resistance protein-like MFS transporter